MARQQLPPQIRKVEVENRRTNKREIRYALVVDVGVDPQTGKRRQIRRRFTTEKAAREALADATSKAAAGTFVARSNATVRDVVDGYIAGKHRLRPTSLAKLRYDLAPLVERHGDMPVQKLTKADLDKLVGALRSGGTITAKGRVRRPWSPAAVNKTILAVTQVLEDAREQGIVPRNVAERVDRIEDTATPVDTYTEQEVGKLLAAFATDRLGHAWELALAGLRRGELAGLRWADVDLDAKTLTIGNNRTSAGGATVEGDTKTVTSARTLPLPPRLVTVLKAARVRQAAERLAVGPAYGSGLYVVSNELGEPYAPPVLSGRWQAAVKAAGVRHIKLHGARHTAATLMHLQGVPIAVVAAWIGHKDASLTMRVYAHSQNDALKAAATSFDRVVTTCDTDASGNEEGPSQKTS